MNWLNRFSAMSKHHKSLVFCIKAFVITLYGTCAWAVVSSAFENWFTVATLLLLGIVLFVLMYAIIVNVLEISDGYEGWSPEKENE